MRGGAALRRRAAALLPPALVPVGLVLAGLASAPAAARPRVVITVPEDRLAAAAALTHTPGVGLGRVVVLPAAELGLLGPLAPGPCAAPGLSLSQRPAPEGPLLQLRLDLAEAGALPRRLRTRCAVLEGDVQHDVRVLIRRVRAEGG